MTLMDDLLRLSRVDAQVRGLRSRLESAEIYLRAQEKQLAQLQTERDELEAQKRQTQAKISNVESEVASVDERLEKLREELNGAVNNKQYTAVLAELNSIKEGRSELEERELEEMERVETLEKQITDVAAQVAEREKVRDIASQKCDQRRSDVGERLTELEAERNAAAAAIPGDHLAVFDEMGNIYDGEAVADIEEIDRRNREYACGVCRMHVPFEAVATLLGGGEALVRCSACGRILFMAEDTRGALAKK